MATKKKGLKAIQKYTELSKAEAMAKEFQRQFDKFRVLDMKADDMLSAWLMEKYIPVLRRGYPEIPCEINFRSSATGSCPRELAMQASNMEADKRRIQKHQRSWQGIGTKIGDYMQEEVLMMEKHYQRKTGEPFNFQFERLEGDVPNFEQFSTKYITVDTGFVKFSTGGSVDGVMIYTDPITMEQTRVGFEVKSKQSSYSATGHFSMKGPNEKHVQQVTNYSILNDLDYYIIVYLSAAHQKWTQTDEEAAKYPDFRCFGIDVTQEMKDAVIEKFTMVCESVVSGELPKLSLNDWLFNGYKKACALSLSYAELEELEEEATDKQQGIIEEIKKLRGDIL